MVAAHANDSDSAGRAPASTARATTGSTVEIPNKGKVLTNGWLVTSSMPASTHSQSLEEARGQPLSVFHSSIADHAR